MELGTEARVAEYCNKFEDTVTEAKINNRKYVNIDIIDLEEDLKYQLINGFKQSEVRKYLQNEIDSKYGRELKIKYVGIGQTDIRELQSSMIGNLVRIEGVVISMSPPQSMITAAYFLCPTCSESMKLSIGDGGIDASPKCFNCSGKMVLIKDESDYEDYQIIKIQEKPDSISMGDIPRVVKIRVVGNHLLDACQPGDSVYVTGVMSVEQRRAKDLVFSWYIGLNNIELDTFDVINTELTKEEVYAIENWALHPQIGEIMINSLFPSIYGHNEEKMGIALALFGGRESERVDITLRGSINILLIGDPSTAKTAMITAASKLAPKALYAQAGSTSGVGLTAAAIREEDQWVLAAGAVVLTNGGTCCIDELEKMNKQDQEAILECMEKQTVSVHKANIHTTLTAKTSILAAANPKYGKYDPKATIADNINLSSPLLARFDLIYILRDIPDEFMDEMIAKRIISGYRDEEIDYEVPIMPVNIIKKYIIYAKRLEPIIPAECGTRMVQYYKDLRNDPNRDTDSPLPITARQLQGLSRLSVAVARMHLREEVTMDDVELAIGLFMSAYGRANTNASGQLDSSMIETGKESRTHTIQKAMEKAYEYGDLLTKEQAFDKVQHLISWKEFEKGFGHLVNKFGMVEPTGDGRWARAT